MHPVFCYGSNMHLGHLRAWMRARALPGEIHGARPARIDGYRLVWNYYSRVWDAAAANVEPAEDAVLHGVALEVDQDALCAIDIKEGHPDCYSRGSSTVRATLPEGQANVWLYVVQPRWIRPDPVRPSRDYLALMRSAAREFALDPAYQEMLGRIEPA